MCSRPPYGYRRVKVLDGSRERPKLEIHPQQAPVVARIFREFLAGAGLKGIARTLNAEGIAALRGKEVGQDNYTWYFDQ
jgi:site-specific DNA recombinase